MSRCDNTWFHITRFCVNSNVPPPPVVPVTQLVASFCNSIHPCLGSPHVRGASPSSMLAVISRAYGSAAGTLSTATTAPLVAASNVTNVVWSWWDEKSSAIASTADDIATKSAIAARAASRIATAVTVQARGNNVAQVTPLSLTSSGTNTKVMPASPVSPTSPSSGRRSPCRNSCTRWSFFCRRRHGTVSTAKSSRLYRLGSQRTLKGTTRSSDDVGASDASAAHRDTPTRRPARRCADAQQSSRPRFVVYLKRRPLQGTDWANALTKLGQDHVGVVIAPFDDISDCGGRLPLSIGSGVTRKQVAFDFGPVSGKDFSIFRITGAQIRCNKFDEGESALVAASHRTWQEIEQFNREYGRTYHLGVSDCRDYAAALVQFMTGINIRPANIAQYIASTTTSSSSLPLGDDEGCDETESTLWSGMRLDMHRLVSGASAPYFIGLGL